MIYFIIFAMTVIGVCSGLIVAILAEDQSKTIGTGVQPAWKQRAEKAPVKLPEKLSEGGQVVDKG